MSPSLTTTARGLGPNAKFIGVANGYNMLVTPALVVQRDSFLSNIAVLADRAKSAGLRLWPHAKTHKSSTVASLQIEHGAAGISVANIHEAEVLAVSGINNILVTSPVIGAEKIRRAAHLSTRVNGLRIVVDHAANVAEVDDALRLSKGSIGVLIDIDIGMGRTGVSDPLQLESLAYLISASPVMTFLGVQGYSGKIQHIESYTERQSIYTQQLDVLSQRVRTLRTAGHEVEMITGGGTGSIGIDIESGVITDHQAGSYVFMDLQYRNVETFPGTKGSLFAGSLTLRASVVSSNSIGTVTIDCGSKALSIDGPVPELVMQPLGIVYEYYGDEHGRLTIGQADKLGVGALVDLYPPHCDPTVNLHDFLHIVSDGVLTDIWRIDARGVL